MMYVAKKEDKQKQAVVALTLGTIVRFSLDEVSTDVLMRGVKREFCGIV